MAGLAPALIHRFRSDVEALTGRPPGPDAMLGLAVSGGPDSMAMLLLAAAAFPGGVRVATVNHGLRPEAADEAALVADLCRRLGVPCAILPLDAGFAFDGNLQEQAREARYLALAHWAGGNRERPAAAHWVATAHHRDDVAESFLMRARRGAGVGGLAEMLRSRPLPGLHATGATLIRPLLDWSRADLAKIVAAAGVAVAADPSNTDPRFDRARIRALLADSPELPPARLARASANLRHAEDALAWLETRLWAERCGTDPAGGLEINPADIPYELRRRLALRAVALVRDEGGLFGGWRGTGIDRLVAVLEAGGTGTIAGVRARAIGGKWRFALAPPRRSH